MLTPTKKKVLNFITSYTNKRGLSPSLQDIRKELGLKSVSTIHQHVNELEKSGYLKKESRRHRSIEISKQETMVSIPLLGTIAAGEPIEAIRNKETIAIPQSKVPKGEIYALRVLGNSMIDENINDGDIILVHRQETAENGQKVVALIDNHEATLKKFFKEKGCVRLQPANISMEPLIFRNSRDVSIQGIVLDVVRTEIDINYRDSDTKNNSKYNKLPLNEIICEDAINVMRQIPDCSIDLTVTSPPYDELRNYNGYVFNFEAIAQGLFRITKKGGVVVWVVNDKIKNGNKSLTSFKQAIFFQKIGFNIHDIMIYKKKNTPFMRSNAYTNCFEFMFILTKGSPKTFNPLKTKTVRHGQEMLPYNKGVDGVNKKVLKELKPEKTMTNIWEYAVGLGGSTSDKLAFKHPAIFPEKLVEDHILSWTNEKDIVFDPMCGSGTTCKMALKNNRFYIGCDISREYVKLAQERLKKVNLNIFTQEI